MDCRLEIVLFALFAAPLAAQLTPSAQFDTGAVRAGFQVAALPSGGSPVWNGFGTSAATSVGSAHLAVQQSCSATAVDVQWQFGCQAVAQTTSSAGASVRYAFASPVAVSGLLSTLWFAQTSGTGTAQLAIDLGDDGTVDASGTDSLPITFGPGVLLVRVTASGNASAGSFQAGWSTWHYSGAAQGTLVLRLEAAGLTSQLTSNACGASPPTFAALSTFAGGVLFAGACGPVDDIAVLALGFAPAAIPLGLPPGCVLGVAPDATAWQLPDAQRYVQWELAVPTAVRPIALHAQLLGLHVAPFQLTTSQALRLTL